MSIYHCSVKMISRSSGRSSVASSAYRAGESITNEREGVRHDYTKKSWQIVHSEIMLPDGASQQLKDRSFLWNEVERTEKRINSQTAREVEVALPKELNRAEQIEVLREYVKDNFVSNGMCADMNIHDKNDGNPHAHIMLPTRTIGENGLFDKKERSWNDKALLEQWRESWAEHCNKYLEPSQQIDHRSYEKQGIDQEPTIHMGGAWAMENRGISTDRGAINIEIDLRNEELKAIHADIEMLEGEIKESDIVVKDLEKQVTEMRWLMFKVDKNQQEPAPAEQKQGYEEMAAIYEKSKNAHVLEPANTHKTEVFEKTAERQAEAKAKIQKAISSFPEEERKQFEVTEENCRRFDRELIEESFVSTPKLADLNQGEKRAEVQKPAYRRWTPEEKEQRANERLEKSYKKNLQKKGTAEYRLETSTEEVKYRKEIYEKASKKLYGAEKALEKNRAELADTSFFRLKKREELVNRINNLEKNIIPSLQKNVEATKNDYEREFEKEKEYQKELASIEKSIASYEKMMAQMQAPAQQEPAQEQEKEVQAEPKQTVENAIFKSPIPRLRKELGMDKSVEESPAEQEKEIIRIPKEHFEEPEKQKSKTQSWSHDR